MDPLETWRKLCFQAFDNDEAANHLILFLEGCGKVTPEGYVVKKDTAIGNDRAFLTLMKELGFTARVGEENNTYVLPVEQWSTFLETKRKARVEWHEQQQKRRREKLAELLDAVWSPLQALDASQRQALVSEYTHRLATNVGSIPFMRGLVGFIRYQLFKEHVAEWRASEYIFTQSDDDSMEAYVRLLKIVLGAELQIVNGDTGAVKINMDNSIGGSSGSNSSDPDPLVLVWRMNGALSDTELSDILSKLPKEQWSGQQDYRLSDKRRSSHRFTSPVDPFYIFYCIKQMFRHCLAILPPFKPTRI